MDESLEGASLPAVQEVAEHLNVSPRYLNDLLQTLAGQSTQLHIQQRMVDKAKMLVSTSSLQVSEIAYQLGFEHPQSFHKLFKRLTRTSPLAYRRSFN